jgi:predicted HD phosphohydrolase
MKKVSFTEMKNGTKEEYLFLEKHEKNYVSKTADRILKYMSGLTKTLEGYPISRLEHSLQSATKALKAGEDEEMIVASLLHDIGDELAPMNHSEYAAAILKPYVSEKTHWIVERHGEFQAFYYAHHLGGDRNKREKYKDHKYYQATIDFCEKYDQGCFDPNYKSLPLEHFEPMVRRIFSRKPYSS